MDVLLAATLAVLKVGWKAVEMVARWAASKAALKVVPKAASMAAWKDEHLEATSAYCLKEFE